VTELLVDQCAHCRHPRAGPTREQVRRGPWFQAYYDGVCSGCGNGIQQGDMIRADGEGGWLNECCGGEP